MEDQQILFMAYWSTIIFIGVFTALISAMITRWFFLEFVWCFIKYLLEKTIELFRSIGKRKTIQTT